VTRLVFILSVSLWAFLAAAPDACGNLPRHFTTGPDARPMPVTVLPTGEPNWSQQWRATVELTPGAHQLEALALHPSGQYLTNASIWFTNGAPSGDTLTNQCGAGGYVTNRVWRDGSKNVLRTQSLAWDAKGRLHRVV